MLDRVGLIIEIFNAHAFTKEAKLQVLLVALLSYLMPFPTESHLDMALHVHVNMQAELAALMYKKTRLVRVRGPGGRYTFGPSGEAEVVSARGLVCCQSFLVFRVVFELKSYRSSLLT